MAKKHLINTNDDTRLTLLEHTIAHLMDILKDIKEENRSIKSDINTKLERIDLRCSRIEEKIDDKFKWTISVIITLFSGLYATALGGMIARLCHWI